MIKIEVKNEEFVLKDKKAPKVGQYGLQRGYAFTHDQFGMKPYPEEIKIFVPTVNGNLQPYKKGFYELAIDSLRVGRYGDLEVGFLNLVPVKQAA